MEKRKIDVIIPTYKPGEEFGKLIHRLEEQEYRPDRILVMNTGKTKQELENNVFQAASIAQKHNCNLIRLDYQQEQGLMSVSFRINQG
mgnify:CR=1 FL=1